MTDGEKLAILEDLRRELEELRLSPAELEDLLAVRAELAAARALA